MRSPAESETSERTWPWPGKLARRSKTKRTANSCSATSSRFDPLGAAELTIRGSVSGRVGPRLRAIRPPCRANPASRARRQSIARMEERPGPASRTRRLPLTDERDSHRLRLQRRELQVRRVEQHRVPIFRDDREKLRDVPTSLHRDVGRVRRVLPSREQGGHAHGSRRAMEGKRLREAMLTLFKVNEPSHVREPFMASRGFRRVRPDEMTSEAFAAIATTAPLHII